MNEGEGETNYVVEFGIVNVNLAASEAEEDQTAVR